MRSDALGLQAAHGHEVVGELLENLADDVADLLLVIVGQDVGRRDYDGEVVVHGLGGDGRVARLRKVALNPAYYLA